MKLFDRKGISSIEDSEGANPIASKARSLGSNWTAAEIPPQWGKLAIVTGGAGGVGYQSALALASAGADVVIADRNEAQAHWAVGRIRAVAPAALVRFEKIDLSDNQSIFAFVERLKRSNARVDLLVNNAGIFGLPRRTVNGAGIEMQFAVNYLGAFALTGLLFPLLAAAAQPRMVQVASIAYRFGSIDLDDPGMARGYSGWRAYCRSKLALLLFTLELARRGSRRGWPILAAAAHPGYARTGLIPAVNREYGLLNILHLTLGRLLSHTAEHGALPILYAATAIGVQGGRLYGPGGRFGLRGAPGEVEIVPSAVGEGLARQLWERSEDLTGVRWPS